MNQILVSLQAEEKYSLITISEFWSQLFCFLSKEHKPAVWLPPSTEKTYDILQSFQGCISSPSIWWNMKMWRKCMCTWCIMVTQYSAYIGKWRVRPFSLQKPCLHRCDCLLMFQKNIKLLFFWRNLVGWINQLRKSIIFCSPQLANLDPTWHRSWTKNSALIRSSSVLREKELALQVRVGVHW